jgi:hypothetical protein
MWNQRLLLTGSSKIRPAHESIHTNIKMISHIIIPTPALSPVVLSDDSFKSINIEGIEMTVYGKIKTHIRISFQKYGHSDSGRLDVA